MRLILPAIIAMSVAIIIVAGPAVAACPPYNRECRDRKPARHYVTNEFRQKIGDIYDPGHGRRVQIRDRHRRILGYVDRRGYVTNIYRQRMKRVRR